MKVFEAIGLALSLPPKKKKVEAGARKCRRTVLCRVVQCRLFYGLVSVPANATR